MHLDPDREAARAMSDTPHLFVYGTLMSAARDGLGRPMRARLQLEGRSLGPATVRGRLYDLGDYPGLIDSEEAADVVHGEVLELTDAAATFAWLDQYEGAVPGERAASEYERVVRSVRLGAGRTIEAWLYLYLKRLDRAALRPSGRWLAAD